MLEQGFEDIQWRQTVEAQSIHGHTRGAATPSFVLFNGGSSLFLAANLSATQVLSSSHIFKSKRGDLPETGFHLLLTNSALLTKR